MGRRNRVWNAALLEAADDPFDISAARLIKLFSSRRIARSAHRVHTYADPFLLCEGEHLYLYLEVQEVGRPGRILGYRTRDLERFEPLGVVLQRDHHLSYPMVF